MTNVKIVTDSASDMLMLDGIEFACVPYKIITEENEYEDTPELDVKRMMRELSEYRGSSSTVSPNAHDWFGAFGASENIFCVCATGALSGSYGAAMTAAEIYKDSFPERNIYVLNSFSAGAEIELIVHRLCELVKQGMEFDKVCAAIEKYVKSTELLFVLVSMKNFASEGKVNPFSAKTAEFLGARTVGRASNAGGIELLQRCRGEVRALEAAVEQMVALGYGGKRVRIGHCFNENGAKNLRALIKIKYPKAHISIYRLRGICSYYAELGGLLVGFERQ